MNDQSTGGRAWGRFLQGMAGAGLAGWMLAVALLFPQKAWAARVDLGWDEPTMGMAGEPLDTLTGFRVYIGTSSGQYDRSLDAGLTNQVVLPDLEPGVTYYFAVTAYDGAHVESPYSAEVVWNSLDEDSDHMPDAWEIAHFGGVEGPAGGLAPLDFDGDGVSDVDEYVAGTDPVNEGSRPVLNLALVDGQPVVTFQAIAASGDGYAGLRRCYQVDSAGALDWPGATASHSITGGNQQVALPLDGAAAGFCRMRAWLEPAGAEL